MTIFEGTSASPGICIGEVFIYNQEFIIPRYSIGTMQVELEIDRFYDSLRKTKEDYEKLRAKIVEEMSEDEGRFLDAHILMTEDQTLIQEVVERLREEKQNVEWIIYQVVDELFKKFKQMDDEYFRDRAIDIMDFGKKIVQKLLSHKGVSLADIDKDVIVVSTDLTVSDTAIMNKKHVLGFVTDFGGRTSHVAILSRSLAIPSIFGIKDVTHRINTGDKIIIDGYKGKAIVNPTNEIILEYEKEQQKHAIHEQSFFAFKDLPSITLDGTTIVLKGNMEIPEQEIESVISHGADGIGLYRSEFLYLSKVEKLLPDETQQFNAYKFILEQFSGKNVTIRTLDLGGDKVLEEITDKEANPYLGWRAIRLCLAQPDIFKTQLRALYRASVFGNLEILIPMITSVEELLQTKELIAEVKKELKKENLHFKDNVPLGVMIETPGAAMVSEHLAKNCDFFSIGTNDLIQYTLACDRGNEKVSYLYDPLHPAILRLLKLTIDNAHKAKIKVSLCGEMASEPIYSLILIGLGIDELSMTPNSILEIKEIVRSIKVKDVKILADEILTMNSSHEIKKKIVNWTKQNLKKTFSCKITK